MQGSKKAEIVQKREPISADTNNPVFVVACKVFPGFVSEEYGILIELEDRKLFTFAPASRVIVDAAAVKEGEYTPGELVVSLLHQESDRVTIRLPQESMSTGDSVDLPRELLATRR